MLTRCQNGWHIIFFEMKRKRKRKTLKGYLKFVICFSVTDKIYFRITCLSVSLKFERYEVAKHIISKNLRAFTSKILKFLVFNNSKHYFIFFNNSIYNSSNNSSNIKNFIFFNTSFNFFYPLYFFFSLCFFLSLPICVSLLWSSCERPPPGPFFLWCWAKPTWMGGVVLLPLKMEVRLVIFFPLD